MDFLVAADDVGAIASHLSHGCISDYHWIVHDGRVYALVKTSRADAHECLRSDSRLVRFPRQGSGKKLSARQLAHLPAGKFSASSTVEDVHAYLAAVDRAFDIDSGS